MKRPPSEEKLLLIESLLGKLTDEEIANELCVGKGFVTQHRRVLGIRKPGFYETSGATKLMGVVSDAELAKKLGIRRNTLTRKRIRLGIKPKHNRQNGEALLQNEFIKTLVAPKEYVSTAFGIIDILTDDAIYELKQELNVTKAHGAIGQLLLYSNAYKNRELVIVAKRITCSKFVLEAITKLGIKIRKFP